MALILTYTSSASLNLHLHKFTPTFLISQYVLLEVTRCSITNPITNPQAYPITTTFNQILHPIMIHVLFQKLVSHYFHISLTTESHTIQSFPQKMNFEMSKTVHLVKLDQ